MFFRDGVSDYTDGTEGLVVEDQIFLCETQSRITLTRKT